MEQVNVFHKGISADLDYSKRGNDVWDFPALNIRVLNKEGQGFVITDLDGNTDPNTVTGEDHRLTPGYIIIGACEYNGIAYICSLDESTGIGEIGCFPSPNTLDYDGANVYPSVIQFQRIYRPLRNFTASSPPFSFTTPRQILNTSLFDWDSTHQIDVFAREDYDNTVNLYLCDYKNPNRIINSGFDQAGNIKNRLYRASDFYSNINQVLTTGVGMDVLLKGIYSGGYHMHGNYIFYFRYLNANLDATPFVAESGPCQMFAGDIADLHTIEGGSDLTSSGKKVTFNLSSLDSTYTWIEAAFTRFHSDTSGVVVSETYLIDKKWNIAGLTSIDITIEGNEDVIQLDISEILKNISTENCCKSHTHTDNMYFGANWKGIDINNDALLYIAQKIVTTYDDSLAVDAESFYYHIYETLDNNNISLADAEGQYKDYFKTYEYSGYFRTECYGYGIICELNNGALTSAYPVTGQDELNGVSSGSNASGVHRFPRQYFSNPIDTNGKARIMGVKFQCAAAWNVIMTPAPGNETAYSDWVKRNVRAIHFVRTPRFINLLYQGLGMNCVTHQACGDDVHLTDDYELTWNYHPAQCPDPGTYNVPGWTMGFQDFQMDSNYNGIGSFCIGQVPFYHAGPNQCHMYHSFWGSSSVNSNDIVDNVIRSQEKYHIPVYKGYMPMSYTYKQTSEFASNYVSRFPLIRKYVGVYSPDDIFVPSAVTNNITYAERQSKVDFQEFRDGDVYYVWDVFPHNILADARTYTYDDQSNPGFAIYQSGLNTSTCVQIGKTTPVYPGSNILFDSNKFINNADDYWTDPTGNQVMYYMTRDLVLPDREHRWSTRSFHGLNYILFKWDYTSVADDFNNSIVNLYQQKPDSITNIGNYISNIASQDYYRISESIELFDSNMNIIAQNYYVKYRGDCFLQKTYFKHLSWMGTEIVIGSTNFNCNWNTIDAWDKHCNGLVANDCRSKRYTHGLVIGFVTENAVNTAMRYQDGGFLYYPYNASLLWAITPICDGGQEGFYYNAGHHQVLSQKVFTGYNIYLPASITKFPTRIRHSNYHIPYSFVDGYRLFDVNSYKDYDMQYGQINSVRSLMDNLVSVQERCINQHYNNEKQLKTPTQSGDLILGMGPILDQQVKRLATFGSQHQWSVNVGNGGIYGVDFLNKVIWQVKVATTSYGTPYLVAANLPLAAQIEKWFYTLSDAIDKRTDILTGFDDNPVNYEGIVTGVDRKYSEVLFTFHYKEECVSVSSIVVNSAPAWQSGFFYAYGMLVYESGVLYYCSTAHTSGMDMTADLSTYFTAVDLTSAVIFSAGTHYDVGQVVCCCGHRHEEGEPDCDDIYVVLRDPYQGVFKECEDIGHIIDHHVLGVIVANRFYGDCNITEQCTDYSRTVVFNELIDAFTCEYSFKPPFYYNIFNDLFSERPFPYAGYVYRHNQDTGPLKFYQAQEDMVLSYIVNGYDTKESAVLYTKLFLSEEIEMSHEDLLKIEYETQYQRSTHDWVASAGDIALKPEYNEHKWCLPVSLQTSAVDDAFSPGTNMRGKWLKTSLYYGGTEKIFIKNVVTNYILSQS